MAVMAGYGGCRVTQGACQVVPISGVTGAGIRGQVTKLWSMATGAAKSEPQGPV